MASKVQSLDQFHRPKEETIDTRPSRSKRGLVGPGVSQVCFKIEKERHQALRVYCATHDVEIGEVLSELMEKHLGI